MNRHERRRAARQDELITKDGSIIAFKHIVRTEFIPHDGETLMAVGGVGQDDKPLTLLLPMDQLGQILDAINTHAKRSTGVNDNGGQAS